MSTNASPTPDQGLPPVLPPSGRQMMQLFIVPALIVLVLVGLFLLGPKVAGWFRGVLGLTTADTRSADQFLTDLDNTNSEVRYRAASDLAQVLLRKEELARDVDFGLGLVHRLQARLDVSAEAEKSFAARAGTLSEGEKARELKQLEIDRNLIIYLAASLGHMSVPLGAPLLGQMASQTGGMEPTSLAERRARALLALATLGEKAKRFDELTDEQKEHIEARLEEVANNKTKESATARATLDHLRARRDGKPTTMGVAAVLAKTADDEDYYLREWTALTSNFWHGTAAEEKLIEDALVRLSADAGMGQEQLEERQSHNPDSRDSRALTKKKGFDVQANATLALARRGSERTPVGMLQEMLDPDRLREIFVIKPRNGNEKPNEALVVLTVIDTLKAVEKLHEKRPALKLEALVPLIEALEKSDNAAIRAQANQTRLALKA